MEKRIKGHIADGKDYYKYVQRVLFQIMKINKEMGISTKSSEQKIMEKAINAFNQAGGNR